MELLDFLTPSDELSANGGPEDHIVLSSRGRLARNISGVPFPGRAKKASREETRFFSTGFLGPPGKRHAGNVTCQSPPTGQYDMILWTAICREFIRRGKKI